VDAVYLMLAKNYFSLDRDVGRRKRHSARRRFASHHCIINTSGLGVANSDRRLLFNLSNPSPSPAR
jgi:hypothetical protein